MHELAPAVELYRPTPQAVQLVIDPAPVTLLYVPFSQAVHAVMPVLLAYLPVLQDTHELEPAAELYRPAAHSWQALRLALKKEPG